jgi:hypothetical protein
MDFPAVIKQFAIAILFLINSMHRLTSDLRMDEISKSLEILRQHGRFFSDFPKRILDKFAEHCKFLAFKSKQ